MAFSEFCERRLMKGSSVDNLTGEELQVRHSDGYVSFTGQLPTYHYFIRDYQGNVVAVVSSEGDVEQRTHYYPYGGWYGESTEPLLQERKYGGKELELTAGVNWYDFGARLQRPDLCRFQTMDPLAEKYYGVSPYAYCMGNPIRYVDPSGMDVHPHGEDEYEMILATLTKTDREYVQLDSNGYIDKELINSHTSDSENFNALVDLVNSEYDISVRLDDKYQYKDNEGNMHEGLMRYLGYDEWFVDGDFQYTNGLTTGETGTYGKTLLPGKSESGVNSMSDLGIEIIVNKYLSEVGRAEAYSHEANGHVLLYIQTGDRHQSGHNFLDGNIEGNIRLRNMILNSRKETIGNIKMYGLPVKY